MEETILTSIKRAIRNLTSRRSRKRKELRRLETIGRIEHSGLFDPEFYLEKYSDVQLAGMNPAQHYFEFGANENRWPSEFFDGPGYLAYNKDLALAKVNPILHWIDYGLTEHRPPPFIPRNPVNLRELCDPYNQEHGMVESNAEFKISILTPTYNTSPNYLRELLQTLLNQRYGHWEWILSDDGSCNPATIATLRELSAADPRVRVLFNPENQGISSATNRAIAVANGSHAALIDHDDLIARDTFLAIYRAWAEDPSPHLFYTDECKLLPNGELTEFWAKSDWSPSYLESTMCIGHLSVYRTDFLRALGGFRSEFDGTQDYDLALRAALETPKVRHLPIFGYLWRAAPESAASHPTAKSYAIERQAQAVLSYARKRHPDAMVRFGSRLGWWRIVYPIGSPPPLMSYVIPTGGRSRMVRGTLVDLVVNCVRSLEKNNFYSNREYVVVHNGDLAAAQLAYLENIPGLTLVRYDAPVFNLSEKLNLGVGHARGEYVCLLNDDVESLTPGGGEELVSYLIANPNVGAIGPLCLYEDGRIQQNGIILLESTGPTHAATGQPRGFGRGLTGLHCRRDAFAVGGAMLFTKKEVYESVGGFSLDLPLNYNDVDFCIKLRDRGYSCVIDPEVVVYHYEGATKIGSFPVEQELLFIKHPDMRDPYFSKWFNPASPMFELQLQRRGTSSRPFGSWLDRHIAHRAANLSTTGRWKLSVCVSVYNQPVRFLEEMYQSYVMQTYENRELIIIDNGSSHPATLEWLARTARESRATFLRKERNIGINGANRILLDAMTGDFMVPLDADDFMTVDALQVMANAIEHHPGRVLFYSDEFKSDPQTTRFAPFFKPDFDPLLLMNCCYPAHLMALERGFLKKIAAYQDDRTTWCHDYDTLTRALSAGEEPVHVRELLYAWRINPGSTASAETGAKPETVESQRFVLSRLLADRGLDDSLALEQNAMGPKTGMWRLRARRPLPNMKILDANELWRDSSAGMAKLDAVASESGVDWVAILLSPHDPHGPLELSAVGWLDPRIAVVSGLLTDASGEIVRWSGGLFLPGGNIIDPYFGRAFSDGGYHGQLWCQRCVDIAAPVNLLIRRDALRRGMGRLKPASGPDALMAMLGLDAHERGEFIAVTPHLRDTLPESLSAALPLDRDGLLSGAAALARGSRWYNGALSADDPYTIASQS